MGMVRSNAEDEGSRGYIPEVYVARCGPANENIMTMTERRIMATKKDSSEQAVYMRTTAMYYQPSNI